MFYLRISESLVLAVNLNIVDGDDGWFSEESLADLIAMIREFLPLKLSESMKGEISAKKINEKARFELFRGHGMQFTYQVRMMRPRHSILLPSAIVQATTSDAMHAVSAVGPYHCLRTAQSALTIRVKKYPFPSDGTSASKSVDSSTSKGPAEDQTVAGLFVPASSGRGLRKRKLPSAD
jgi:hypothetical protein